MSAHMNVVYTTMDSQVVAYDQRRNENRVALREVRQKTLAKSKSFACLHVL